MRVRLLCAVSMTILATSALTGCGGKAEKLEASPYTSGNYPGTLKIGKPYDIGGRTYVPHHDPNYMEEGIASWYGPGFHGRSTANGERFDQNALTAAHRTLPMPSVVRVTNLENGKAATITVNDRGPFAKDRIIDLSKASAERLGVIAKGTARVRVQYLPQESRRLITELVRTNQLRATEDTLEMLAMNDIEPPLSTNTKTVVERIPPGIGLVSSAYAAESGISDRAPLAPVASRELPAPGSVSPAAREGVQLARLEREAATPRPPVSYEEGGVAPRVMPLRKAPPRMPMESVPASMPRELQHLPDSPAEERLSPQNTPEAQAPQASVPAYEREPVAGRDNVSPSGIFIQAGSFSQAQNAHALSERLTAVANASVKPVDINGRTWYRVRVGPLSNMSTAHSALQNLQNMGIQDAHVVKD